MTGHSSQPVLHPEVDQSAVDEPFTERPWLGVLKSCLPFAVLAVVAIVHIGLVVDAVAARGALDHDGVISHLAASGHLDDWQLVFEGGEPTGTWAPGSVHRGFLEIDDDTSMAEVRDNLARHDLHPPLFFWALSGARSLGLGILWSGPILNLGAVLLAGVILYALVAEAVNDRLLAALAVAVFALSPALVVAVSSRQYPSLMLAVVSLIWITARLLRTPTSPWLLASLVAVGALGLLSAHQFAFALGGALLTVTLRWAPSNRRAIGCCLAATIGSVLVALALHPAFFTQLSRERALVAPLTESVGERIWVWGAGMFDLVTVEPEWRGIVGLGFVVGAVALLATARRWFRPAARVIRDQPIVGAALGVGGTALVAATAMFLAGSSPFHARGWQYVIAFWPAIVLLGTVVVTRNLAQPAFMLIVVVMLLGVSVLRSGQVAEYDYRWQRNAVEEVSGATLVVADCLMRGYTPGATMWVPRESRVLLVAPGDVAPPALPQGADASRPLLLHADDCRPAVQNIDRVLETLGFVRGVSVGRIGFVDVFRLEPI